MLPALFFLLRIDLAMQALFWFHMKFTVFFFQFYEEGPEVLIRKMKERDITVLPVIDENDKLIGEITLESAAILRRKV